MEEEGVSVGGGGLRKSSIKQSQVGEGVPRQSDGEAIQLISLLDTLAYPLNVPILYLKCGYCDNAEANEVESRANRDWMGPMFV